MANPGQPTIAKGATGPAVRRAQRAIFRTDNHEITIDGIFGDQTERFVKESQAGYGLTQDGIVGPATWAALPDGAPMPLLIQGSSGPVVSSLQQVLHDGAGAFGGDPGVPDGIFGPQTKAAVEAFQVFSGLGADGEVGDLTWTASLHAASATLESVVGLNFVVD